MKKRKNFSCDVFVVLRKNRSARLATDYKETKTKTLLNVRALHLRKAAAKVSSSEFCYGKNFAIFTFALAHLAFIRAFRVPEKIGNRAECPIEANLTFCSNPADRRTTSTRNRESRRRILRQLHPFSERSGRREDGKRRPVLL